jgi:hypothetical protein
LGTLLVSALILAFYFFTSIPDADDAFHLNLAAGAKRERDAIYVFDTMLGIPGLDILKSTYRVESYQLLAALISDFTGLTVVNAAHAVIPALVCVWTSSVLMLIHYALFRNAWLITVLLHLAWLIALDGSVQSYGAYEIPRFFHGKGPFVTTMVPLIAFLTVSVVRERSFVALLLLGCAIIISIGFTANAIYAGPLTAALIAAPLFLLGDLKRKLTCFRLIWVIVYPATLATILLLFDPPAGSEMQNAGTVGKALWAVFGTNYALAFGLALMFGAALVSLSNYSLRIISLYVIVLLISVLNPFLWDIYGASVTGNINNRLLWSVPLPLIVAIISGLIWTSQVRTLRFILMVFVITASAAPGSIFYKAEWGFSASKVPNQAFRVAQTVNDIAPEGVLILAPEEISTWIPTLDNGKPVVESRSLYIPQRKQQLNSNNLRKREKLFEWVSQETSQPVPSQEIISAIVDLDVRVIVIRTTHYPHGFILEFAYGMGFLPANKSAEYLVFVKN